MKKNSLFCFFRKSFALCSLLLSPAFPLFAQDKAPQPLSILNPTMFLGKNIKLSCYYGNYGENAVWARCLQTLPGGLKRRIEIDQETSGNELKRQTEVAESNSENLPVRSKTIRKKILYDCRYPLGQKKFEVDDTLVHPYNRK